LRLRLGIFAALILTIALGLVGMALNAAHQQSVVASLHARMESYVYLVLAAVDVAPDGNIVIVEELGDPRFNQPGSGIYAQIETSEDRWRSPSAIAEDIPDLPLAAAGDMLFFEPGNEAWGDAMGAATDHPVDYPEFYIQQYGADWQFAEGYTVPLTVTVLADRSEARQHIDAFAAGLLRYLLAAGLILILALGVVFILAYRPLGRVARDVALIESGRASRLEGNYPRELELLTRNVNRLLETEKASQERYRHALDSLAHSLKTPLAVITAGLEVHGGDAAGSMKKASEDIHHLIATRLQRARSSTRRTLSGPVTVAPECKRIIQSLQKVYSHKMIEVEVTIPPELQFYGDKRDLLELMGNLVDNAFKFGSGRVRVAGGVIEPGIPRPGFWLKIEDDGDGIEDGEWSRLLQRGVRGDERVEGHGLGLAIVLELVSAYGGEISIGHSDLGGALIYVEIPPD
jgi:two-component system sensor histidine kinase PhoQ